MRYLLLFLLAGSASAQEAPFSALKTEVTRIESELGKELKAWNAKYEAQLDKLEQAASKSGKLNQVVAVRHERQHYAGDGSAVDDRYPELLRARGIYEKKRDALDYEQAGRQLNLWKGYRRKLQELEVRLTRAQQIEAALQVQTEGKAADARLAALNARMKSLKPTTTDGTRPGPSPGPSSGVPAGTLVAFGTYNNGTAVTLPAKPSGYVQVAATGTRILAVKADGTTDMFHMGGIHEDQHRDGVSRLKKVRKVAMSNNFNLALHLDGTVSVWGRHSNMKLAPKQLENVTDIAGGTFVSMALHKDGTVTAWGHYVNSRPEYPSAGQIKDVVRIACGENRMWVEKRDGEILFSHAGGSHADPPDDRITRVQAMTAGLQSGCLFLTESGKVLQWGGMKTTEKLPRARAIRAGGNLYALQRKDLTWMIWGPLPLAKRLQEELDRIGPLKDLALASGSDTGYFIGIQ